MYVQWFDIRNAYDVVAKKHSIQTILDPFILVYFFSYSLNVLVCNSIDSLVTENISF